MLDEMTMEDLILIEDYLTSVQRELQKEYDTVPEVSKYKKGIKLHHIMILKSVILRQQMGFIMVDKKKEGG